MSKYINIDEQQRIKRILNGRREEYAYFVKTYSQKVLDFISRLVPDKADVEELAQDAFVKAFHSLASFQGQASFSTWLCRIAYHESLNHLKRRRLYWIDIEEAQLSETDLIDKELSTGKEERIALLEEALDNISPDERMLVHLYYYQNLAMREIAFIMDAEPSALTTRLHRIRKKLLTMIKQKEDEQYK